MRGHLMDMDIVTLSILLSLAPKKKKCYLVNHSPVCPMHLLMSDLTRCFCIHPAAVVISE